MEIIAKVWIKCKSEWFGGLVLIMVALIAFGLGRLSQLRQPKFPVQIKNADVDKNINNNITTQNKNTNQVVGSKQGSKYHFSWCSGAKSIKAENLITFTSIEEAKAAGYTPAGNCKGLN